VGKIKPYQDSELNHSFHFLDTTGRPVVVLNKKSVAQNMIDIFVMLYDLGIGPTKSSLDL